MSKRKKRILDLDRDSYQRDQDCGSDGEGKYSIRKYSKESKEDRYKKNVIVAPQTAGQKEYIQKILNNDIVFCTGPAGSGKTACAVGIALQQIMAPIPAYEKIIVMRPLREACGEKLGALPGELALKLAPWAQPIVDNMEVFIDKNQIKNLFYQEKVEVIPIAYARGRSLNKAFVIVDEAQNCTQDQLLLILTRLGKESKMLINGDLAQSDIKSTSGLYDAIQRLHDIPRIDSMELTTCDIVRHPLIAKILERYFDEK